MVFSEKTCENSIQQDNIIRFLSSHKKYRVFGWEFGPTLLDQLYGVKNNRPDYTKSGLILTYSIASIAAFVSFASTRRATVAAAVTLGIILLGIATTATIDYQKTKRKDSDELIDQSELLRLLGETRQYWWWPWSSKISEVALTESKKERAEKYSSYSFLYRVILVLFTSVLTHRLILFQQNGGYMGKSDLKRSVSDSELVAKSRGVGVPLSRRMEETKKQQPGPSGSTVQPGALWNIESINFLESAMVYNMNLERALYSLGFSSQTLTKLDESLARVRDLGYSKEAREEYDSSFKEIFIKQYRQLALKFHPDKQHEETKNSSGAQGKSEKMDNLNKMNQIMEKLYEVSKEKDSFRYTLFSKIAFDLLHQKREECATLINGNVVAELENVTIWRQSGLMYSRNEFLSNAQKYLGQYGNNLHENKKLEDDFRKLQEQYIREYEQLWLTELRGLNNRCKKKEELKVIMDEVDNLVNKSTRQLNILNSIIGKKGKPSEQNFLRSLLGYIFGKNDSTSKEFYEQQSKIPEREQRKNEDIDGCFVLPILEYIYVMGMYKKLSKAGIPKSLVVKFRRYAEIEGIEEFSIQERIGKLSFEELQKEIEVLEDFLFNQRDLNLQEQEVMKYINHDKVKAKVILVQALEEYGKFLEDKFKKEKTLFQRMEEEIKEIEENKRKIKKEIEEIQKTTEQTGIVSTIFLEMMLDSEMDRELEKITLKSQIIIVQAVVQHVIENNSSPEQILNAIIEKIKLNEDQIIKEGTIDVELIEGAVKPFIVTVNKEHTEPRENINEREESIESEIRNFLGKENVDITCFLGCKEDDQQVKFLKHIDFRQCLIQFIKAQGGNFSRVEYILGEKAKKELVAISGIFSDHQEQVSLYSIALQEDKPKVAEFLKKKGANREEVSVDSVDQNGKTLLYYAVWEGLLEAVEFLVYKGADVHAEGTHGEKPIHIATTAGHRNIVEFFLLNRISVNEADKFGYTPLHYAAYNGRLKMVQFLIDSGANIHAQAQNGKTPSDLARKAGHGEVVDMLSSINTKVTGVSISQPFTSRGFYE
ncbi:ankyrin repeat domain-containing protein [Wolbachia endosymbiont (group A) of Pogonocherus hispidulus]|uniref:ankyrin repeat domain-containing protein n=1 Tax=Wolbachia endosymbiont (group A) of Pogonocherus hispidulus TaxID=3066136 RepID=UPI00333E291F